MRTKDLFNFMWERHRIYIARADNKPKPWTNDPILQSYRFCNVYRELDKVTVWIAKNWRAPNRNDPHLWFAMVVARLFNLPDTLKEIGFPVPFKPSKFYEVGADRKVCGEKVFNGAYIVSTNGRAMDKVDYVVEHVLQPLWEQRADVRDVINLGTLYDVHTKLMQFQGLGSFMAAQVIADLKYVKPLSAASDWKTFAASGPGSRRGLNRVIGRDVEASWRESEWLLALNALHRDIENLVRRAAMPDLHAQDLQNCLCEFDKYERVRLGQGTPKQKYQGA